MGERLFSEDQVLETKRDTTVSTLVSVLLRVKRINIAILTIITTISTEDH